MDADLRVQTEHAAIIADPSVTEHPDTEGSVYSVEIASSSIGIELEALAFRPKAAQPAKTRLSPMARRTPQRRGSRRADDVARMIKSSDFAVVKATATSQSNQRMAASLLVSVQDTIIRVV